MGHQIDSTEIKEKSETFGGRASCVRETHQQQQNGIVHLFSKESLLRC